MKKRAESCWGEDFPDEGQLLQSGTRTSSGEFQAFLVAQLPGGSDAVLSVASAPGGNISDRSCV